MFFRPVFPYAIRAAWWSDPCALNRLDLTGQDERKGAAAAAPGVASGAGRAAAGRRRRPQFSASSVIACVQAPSGSWVMTGSEPPDSSESTVRW